MPRPRSASPRNKNVSVLFNREELDLIEAALRTRDYRVSYVGRDLLLQWAKATLRRPGSVIGGPCTSAPRCQGVATRYYTMPRSLVCDDCASKVQAQYGAAVITDPPISFLAVDAVLAMERTADEAGKVPDEDTIDSAPAAELKMLRARSKMLESILDVILKRTLKPGAAEAFGLPRDIAEAVARARVEV